MSADNAREPGWYVDEFSRLITEDDLEGAARVAQEASNLGVADAARMNALVDWYRGDREVACEAWQGAVAAGDLSALAYLAMAAHAVPSSEEARAVILARLTEALRGPGGEDIIGRILGACHGTGVDGSWAEPVLLQAHRDGVHGALEAYFFVCSRGPDELAQDADADPDVLLHLTGVRTGMTAWYACSNPALPEPAARDVLEGTAESLIRAIASNEGLSPGLRDAAEQRLMALAAVLPGPTPSMPVVPETSRDGGVVDHGGGDDLRSKFKDTRVTNMAMSAESGERDVWGDLVAGNFTRLLDLAYRSGEGAFDLATARATAMAWRADQEPESQRMAALAAKDAFERISGTETAHARLFSTLSAAVVSIRHSLGDARDLLEASLDLLQHEDDGVPLFSTNIQPPELARDSCHPWVAEWLADLRSLLQDLKKRFPSCAGAMALARGDLEAAEAALGQAIASANPCVRGQALNTLVFGIYLPQERYDEATRLLITNAGSPWTTEGVNSRSNLGIIAFKRGDFGRARRLFAEVKAADDAHTAPEAMYYLAMLDAREGQHKSATRLLMQILDAEDTRYASMARIAFAETLMEQDEASGDPSALNSAGCYLRDENRKDEARLAFLRAAELGDPNALASLTWPLVVSGAMEDAIVDFEMFSDAVARHVKWSKAAQVFAAGDPGGFTVQQLLAFANARSNAALAYLATGNPARALELWREAAAVGHVEARVYPAVLAWRQEGALAAYAALADRANDVELREFAGDMLEVLRDGNGWFRDWACDALDLITSSPLADPLLICLVAAQRYETDIPALTEAMRSPALLGVPPAMALLVWALRRSGDPTAAIEAFEECVPLMESYLNSLPEVMPAVVPDGQGSGSLTILRAHMEESAIEVLVEAGVAYLLLDRAEEANRLWSDLRVRRSPEALVGRAALALRAGDGAHARELVQRLLPEHRERISSDLRGWVRDIASSEASSVFAEAERLWYEECLSVLEEISGIAIPLPRPGA